MTFRQHGGDHDGPSPGTRSSCSASLPRWSRQSSAPCLDMNRCTAPDLAILLSLTPAFYCLFLLLPPTLHTCLLLLPPTSASYFCISPFTLASYSYLLLLPPTLYTCLLLLHPTLYTCLLLLPSASYFCLLPLTLASYSNSCLLLPSCPGVARHSVEPGLPRPCLPLPPGVRPLPHLPQPPPLLRRLQEPQLHSQAAQY